MVSYTISEFNKLKNNDLNLDDLDDYLKDIISSIEEELSENQNNHKQNFNDENDWRTRKNPKFMEKYSSEDKVNLEINGNLNKITKDNYEQIYKSINTKLKEQDKEKVINLLNLIYQNILTKAFNQSIFAEYYLKFIIKMKSEYKQFDIYIYKTIDLFLETLNDLDYENEELSNYKNNLDIHKNYGLLLGHYYKQNLISYENIIIPLINHIKNIQSLIEWNPIDINKLESKINIFTGFMISSEDSLWNKMDRDSQQDFRCQIKNIIQNKNMPIKLRFAIQEIDELIDTNIQKKIKKYNNNNNNNNIYNT